MQPLPLLPLFLPSPFVTVQPIKVPSKFHPGKPLSARVKPLIISRESSMKATVSRFPYHISS